MFGKLVIKETGEDTVDGVSVAIGKEVNVVELEGIVDKAELETNDVIRLLWNVEMESEGNKVDWDIELLEVCCPSTLAMDEFWKAWVELTAFDEENVGCSYTLDNGNVDCVLKILEVSCWLVIVEVNWFAVDIMAGLVSGWNDEKILEYWLLVNDEVVSFIKIAVVFEAVGEYKISVVILLLWTETVLEIIESWVVGKGLLGNIFEFGCWVEKTDKPILVCDEIVLVDNVSEIDDDDWTVFGKFELLPSDVIIIELLEENDWTVEDESGI